MSDLFSNEFVGSNKLNLKDYNVKINIIPETRYLKIAYESKNKTFNYVNIIDDKGRNGIRKFNSRGIVLGVDNSERYQLEEFNKKILKTNEVRLKEAGAYPLVFDIYKNLDLNNNMVLDNRLYYYKDLNKESQFGLILINQLSEDEELKEKFYKEFRFAKEYNIEPSWGFIYEESLTTNQMNMNYESNRDFVRDFTKRRDETNIDEISIYHYTIRNFMNSPDIMDPNINTRDTGYIRYQTKGKVFSATISENIKGDNYYSTYHYADKNEAREFIESNVKNNKFFTHGVVCELTKINKVLDFYDKSGLISFDDYASKIDAIQKKNKELLNASSIELDISKESKHVIQVITQSNGKHR